MVGFWSQGSSGGPANVKRNDALQYYHVQVMRYTSIPLRCGYASDISGMVITYLIELIIISGKAWRVLFFVGIETPPLSFKSDKFRFVLTFHSH